MRLKINYQNFAKTYPKKYKSAIFYPSFLKLKNKGFDFRTIKKILGTKVRRSTIYSWFNGTTPSLFKEFSAIKREFDTNDLKQLAIIVGHIFGDGGISKKKFLHYCNTEDFLINEFQDAMKIVLNFDSMYKHKESTGIIRLRYPRLASRIFLSLFGEFSLGRGNKRVTPQIEKMPIWWKKILLRSWYDDDGSVPESGHYKCVTFKQKDKDLISWIQKTLKELNIKSKLDRDGTRWHLRILNYLNMVKFKDKIGFSNGYRKQLHLEKIIKEAKCPHWKTKLKILELLKGKPRTDKELADILKLDHCVIWSHMFGSRRKKRKNTIGLVNMNLVNIKKNGRINVYSLRKKEYKKLGKVLNLESYFNKINY